MLRRSILAGACSVGIALPAWAHDAHDHSGGLKADPGNAVQAAFDIIHARITTEGNVAVFQMAVSGKAGTRITRGS